MKPLQPVDNATNVNTFQYAQKLISFINWCLFCKTHNRQTEANCLFSEYFDAYFFNLSIYQIVDLVFIFCHIHFLNIFPITESRPCTSIICTSLGSMLVWCVPDTLWGSWFSNSHKTQHSHRGSPKENGTPSKDLSYTICGCEDLYG